MGNLKLLFTVFATVVAVSEGQFTIGLGRFDVTGASAEVPFMGYGNMAQRGNGIHLRQYSRVFIVQDSAARRIVYASVEIQGISHAMRRDVVTQLQQRFGNMYRLDNVMLSATHTHGGPGGYFQHVLYDITCMGFIADTYNTIVNGIVQSIVNAHNSMTGGRIFLTETQVNDVSVQRSPKAYINNPLNERNSFGSDVDRVMTQLRFVNNAGTLMGAFSWLAVHTTSMNNTNLLVSSDNFGWSAQLLEREFNPGQLPGRGNFVGALCSAHTGDISPNIMGPRCELTGLYCDELTSACPANTGDCVATGPGVNHVESTRIIGQRIYDGASRLVRQGGGRELTGAVGFIHQFVEMATVTGTVNGQAFRGCRAALGMSFAAGTTDGPGAFDFTQGDTSGNPFWNAVRDFLAEPTADDHACHSPKPILLMVGSTFRPYLWVPNIVPTQLFSIGEAVIVGLPGEFSTMSARRIRRDIQSLGAQAGRNLQVILSGTTNIYSSYTVTPEEYQIQRYEGASTMYGPHTHTIYNQQFNRLYTAMANNQAVAPGPTPWDERSSQLSFLTPIVNDDATGTSFGALVVAPRASYRRGETVFVTFVSGNPRNNPMADSSFFHAEILQGNVWVPVATDANWETRFVWRRTNTLLGRSEIDFFWDIPQTVANGLYRIRHDGFARGPITGVREYQGTTQAFNIIT